MTAHYPTTRTTEDVEELSGIRFPDPYRWLENETEEVRRWQDEQGDVASGFVRDWPHFDRLRDSVEHFSTSRFGSLPRCRAGQWFRTETADGASQARVVVADEPFGAGRVLFSPTKENPTKPPFVSWFSPSPDGRLLAVGVCSDGSERNTIRLIDVETGTVLTDPPSQPLKDNWTGGAHWLPDSSGFFFTGALGDSTDLTLQVLLHRRGPTPSTTPVDVDWLDDPDYRTVVVSGDGRHAVALQRMLNPVPVAVAELKDTDELIWRPFITAVEHTLAGYLLGDEWIAITDLGAPRGRVVSVQLDNPTPNEPASWQELVPESNATLRALSPVGDMLYLAELVDTYSTIRIIDRSGDVRGQVPMPGKGALAELPFPFMTLLADASSEEFLFAFSTLTSLWGTYRHQATSTMLEVLQKPAVVVDDAVIEDGWATSDDGTRIPFHLVRRRDVGLNRPRPSMIYAYGGFNAHWAPQFPGPMAAFVDAGGVFVHAHLRGGAEFGRDWWYGGRRENKQNCYADLYAVARDLISTGITSPGLLAVTGGSNGGLLAGVAATQRPHLWSAVIPRVPLLDLLAACRDPYGRYAVTLEYGDPDDSDEVRRMATFSPYQLVKDGIDYPAVFLDAGATDPRCPPWHARKFAARLQAATSGDAPILLRVWGNVGHGWATDKKIAIDQSTEWLAFAMKILGLTPETPVRTP